MLISKVPLVRSEGMVGVMGTESLSVGMTGFALVSFFTEFWVCLQEVLCSFSVLQISETLWIRAEPK